MENRSWPGWRFGLAALAALALAGTAVAGPRVAEVDVTADAVAVRPLIDNDGVQVRVSGPGGAIYTGDFARGETPVLSLANAKGDLAGDGTYKWEVVVKPRLGAATRAALAAARAAQDASGTPARIAATRIESGSFQVVNGAVLVAGEEPRAPDSSRKVVRSQTASEGPAPAPLPDDQVIPDDLIVQGSLCVGLDCVNNEAFSFDTIRLKENSTRIAFIDTSGAGFPSHDWQLRANDAAGAGLFAIDFLGTAAADGDTPTTTPFVVEASATSNSVFVDSTGRVGFRTSTPVLDLHVNTGNTPALRLEQNNSSGFTAQTWDVAGNEASFFVRDVTGGSRLPFRIQPGAPSNSLTIESTGDVGVGTLSPAAGLDVVRSTGAVAALARLANNSGIQLLFDRTDAASDWQMSNFNTSFQISVPGAITAQFNLSSTGNLTIAGTLTELSDRSAKGGFADVDVHAVLAKVADLPISTWHYKGDAQQHMGPVAQDFAAAFGLGPDDKHIAPKDLAGVALAAIQALNQVVADKDVQLKALQAQNSELAGRLAAIEAALAARK